MSENDVNQPERRASQAELLEQVQANRDAIAELQKALKEHTDQLEDLEKLLQPVAEFYGLMRSDIDTLGRFGRGLRSFLAWGAAVLISLGVLIAWARNGFKLPGG